MRDKDNEIICTIIRDNYGSHGDKEKHNPPNSEYEEENNNNSYERVTANMEK